MGWDWEDERRAIIDKGELLRYLQKGGLMPVAELWELFMKEENIKVHENLAYWGIAGLMKRYTDWLYQHCLIYKETEKEYREMLVGRS